jgi:DNA-binding NarL/FixJ family response regulator
MNKPVDDAPQVLALAADLLFASRIRGAGQAAGTAVALARTPDELVRQAAAHQPALILVDLHARGDAASAIRAIRQAQSGVRSRIVAFASHTDAAAIQAARDAGADRVLARSAFMRELPALLRLQEE